MMRNSMVIVCFLGFQSPALLLAGDCSALKGLQLPDTAITAAARVSSGTVEGPRIGDPQKDLPVFCRVQGILRPTPDSEINFEVWLPEKDWNGRILGVGNGGFAGTIGYHGLAGNLRRGFATAGSDAGHQAEAEDATWAFGHPEKIKDFGWRAVHLTAVRAKDIVKAYYGKPQQKAYFDSCSDGGREALMEAQRFPEDYDGILAGAPAYSWTHMLTSGVEIAQAMLNDPRAYISSLKLPAIERAALDACDEIDGVKDGIIGNPAQCHFDPAVLLCKSADSLDCLSQPQVNSLKNLYAGGHNNHGNSLLPGLLMGDEDGDWRDWVVGEAPGAGAGTQFVQNYFRYMVTGDPKWNVLTADVDASLEAAIKQTAADLDATSPDLSRFSASGGKLILYHGWNDAAIPPVNTIAYFESVEKQMGPSQADSFMRLYMAPGVEHCAGGPGPSSFGQLGLSTAKGPKYGLFDALQDWVEKAVPASEVVASKYTPGPKGDPAVTMTRPLCPYPAIAKYKGTGETNDSANFACSTQ